jgi:glycosyltransferase involved in cell wall biosynthesis
MASSLPVIVSSRCGCADDLVEDGGNGYVFDPDHEMELAARMALMLRAGDARRRSMGGRSLEIISRYSPERWAEEVARIVYDKPVPGRSAA